MRPPAFSQRLTSIRGRLVTLIAALAVPMLAIVTALCWEAFRSQSSAMRAELRNTARAVASLVDSEIDRSVAILRTMASTRAAQESDWTALDATARRVLGANKVWFLAFDAEGRQFINTRLPYGSPLPGTPLSDAYRESIQDRREYVSNLIISTVSNKWVVHVSHAFVHPTSGQTLAFSLVIDPDYFGETLNVARFAPGGVLSVLDRTGRVIVRSPGQHEFSGKMATPDIVKATTEHAEGMGESVTLERIPVITAFVRAQCGWSVAIGSPKMKLFQSARGMLILAIGSSLGLAALAIGLAVAIGRAVVRSVDDLTADADLMGRGLLPADRPGDLRETHYIGQAMRRMAQALATELKAKIATEGELRNARDQLHEYAQQLEKRVEERTASLKDAVTQMEEFSYTVSHDLRSPLRAINGYAEVLLQEHSPSLDAEAKDYLKRIKRASERMDQLTTDVLAYSRVARAEVRVQSVDLERIIRNTVEHYSELHPRLADITICTPIPNVLAHEQSLSQALANLLTNAAKFVKPGERPSITIRTERRDDQVRIWVEDRGIGIPKAHQGKLFHMFERAPTDRNYEGTGVGLAIVRKCLEKMGGTCGVESDGVTGSRFWLELRAAS